MAVTQRQVGPALLERREDGAVTFITPGGLDPVFNEAEQGEVIAFLGHAPKAVAKRSGRRAPKASK